MAPDSEGFCTSFGCLGQESVDLGQGMDTVWPPTMPTLDSSRSPLPRPSRPNNTSILLVISVCTRNFYAHGSARLHAWRRCTETDTYIRTLFSTPSRIRLSSPTTGAKMASDRANTCPQERSIESTKSEQSESDSSDIRFHLLGSHFGAFPGWKEGPCSPAFHSLAPSGAILFPLKDPSLTSSIVSAQVPSHAHEMEGSKPEQKKAHASPSRWGDKDGGWVKF